MKFEATAEESDSFKKEAVAIWIKEMMEECGPLLTRPQACGYLNCGEQWIIKSSLPHVRLGNSIRYRLKDLKRFEEENLVK